MLDLELNKEFDLVFQLDEFDGPLDLLLYLIKKDEIDIYDIPIAEITRQYLGYLEVCKELNLEIAGEFLYMAAMLIRIKAQMLIPRPGDDTIWEDPRSELVKALLEYKKVKQISSALDDMAQTMRRRYCRRDFSSWDIAPPEPELVRVDLTALMIAFGDILRRAVPDTSLQIEPVQITVDSRKDHILSILNSGSSFELEDFFVDDPRRIVMIVTFIALLDMVKDGLIRIEQADRFTTIRIFLNSGEPALVEEAL
ncbi:MAG: segregation/condensation protein A [Candidatus Zixiibacteriota bacterium]|nr:MAG: segregation/condensation protein A [candidate division Zixibacteria bacterium]